MSVRPLIVFAAVWAMLPICVAPVSAQETRYSESVRVEIAVLRQIPSAAANRLVLIPSYMTTEDQRMPVLRDTLRIAQIVQAVGVRVASLEETLTCPAGSRSCRLNDADAVVGLSLPAVQGSNATIVVATWYSAPGATRPVAYTRELVALSRDSAGSWSVVSRQLLAIS